MNVTKQVTENNRIAQSLMSHLLQWAPDSETYGKRLSAPTTPDLKKTLKHQEIILSYNLKMPGSTPGAPSSVFNPRYEKSAFPCIGTVCKI